MTFLRKALRWIRALGPWLMQAQPVWGPVGVLLLPVVAVFLVPESVPPSNVADRLRYLGLTFQLLGIATVVSGLRARRRLFGRSSLVERFWAWLKGRPRWGAGSRTYTFTGHVGVTVSASGKAFFWRGVPVEASAEQRLSVLEANLLVLRTELEDTEKELREQIGKAATAGELERRTRVTADLELRTQIERLGAEGLHIEMAGVLWLVTGIVLATIPEEIACVVSWGLRK